MLEKSSQIEVLILAGGKGSRLKSVLSDMPKPMADIGGIPFLELLISSLKNYGLDRYCLLTGHKADSIRNCFGNGSKMGVLIRYSHEEIPLGTGGAIKKAIESSSSDTFLCLNGDSYFGANIDCFISDSLEKIGRPSSGLLGGVALKEMGFADRYGSVEIDEAFRILGFHEKKLMENVLINSGIYLFTKSITEYIGSNFVSLENDVFPKLVSDKALLGLPYKGNFIDIGIPEDYYYACKHLKSWISHE